MNEARKPSAQNIYETLRSMIANLEVMPGSRITENQLADYFQVSRTPIRAALQLLENDGMLSIKPKQGCFVRNIDLQQISDYYDVRVYLENMSLEEIHRRSNKENLSLLANEWDPERALFGAEVDERLKSAEEEFHLRLAEVSKNSVLASYLADITNKIRVVRILGWPDQQSVDDTYQEHFRICSLLLCGDLRSAQEEMTNHIRKSQDRASRITLDQLYSSRKVVNFD